jgi:hypothetical protein
VTGKFLCFCFDFAAAVEIKNAIAERRARYISNVEKILNEAMDLDAA